MKSDSRHQTGHIVSHTHWDREWRYTIWETRIWLVKFMDELLDLLEQDIYTGFLMDGQMAPVLDYLQVRPERHEQIKKFVSSGKLEVGPWYTLPDEYPVDPEALLRNLLTGRREAEKLGRVFNAGYTSFGWGQIAQLPQIYAGFEMDVAFIGKRVNRERAPYSEFIWRAPDGSQLLTSRFGDMGRQNFYFQVNLQGLYGLDHQTWDWKYSCTDHGILFHRADRAEMEQDHFRIDAPRAGHLESISAETAEKTWQSTDESVLENDRLMMNGCDYAAAQPALAKLIERLKQVDPAGKRQWKQCTMSDFVDLMRRKIDPSELPVVDGELRDGPVGLVTGNALSTRQYLKQMNKKAQNALIRQAEPLCVMAAAASAGWPDFLLQKAWEYLLDSHPHDSINGVTQDKTANDVYNRLEQVYDISRSLSNQAMMQIIAQMDLGRFAEDEQLLVVFNPQPYERRDVVEAFVTTPKKMVGTPKFNDDLGFLQVYEADGQALATQWEGAEEVDYCVAELHARILPYYSKRHRLLFDTGPLPAMGYKVFRLGRNQDIRPAGTDWSDNQALTGSILKNPHTMENEFLTVVMNPNGTFNLTDRQTGREYRNLNYYEDRGEHGTYWINYKPMHQQVYTSLGCQARIWSEEAGPVQATICSEIDLLLPQRGDKAGQKRGDAQMPLTIRTAVTLKKGGRQAEVRVSFDNRHEDHLLRAMFPTGLTGVEFADAGGHFYVDRRPVRPQGPTADSKWPDMATQPHLNFVDLSDGQQGIAFINDCLNEYEVLEDDQRTVALSLLRAVKTWIVTGHVGSDFPSQKGGQCPGRHELRYAVRPHSGNWQQAGIFEQADFFNAPLIPVQTNPHGGRQAATSFSFLKIDDARLRFASFSRVENGNSYRLRLFNPGGDSFVTTLETASEIHNIWLTNLAGERQAEVKPLTGHSFKLDVLPYKIITVELDFGV